jgi:hypothetical protein
VYSFAWSGDCFGFSSSWVFDRRGLLQAPALTFARTGVPFGKNIV